MLEAQKKRSILRLMIKISTLTGALFLSLSATAKPNYVMTVVKEARVESSPSASANKTLACKTTESFSKAEPRLRTYGNVKHKHVKLMQIRKGVALFAVRNTMNNESDYNSVTIWMGVRAKGKTAKYYPLTEVDMEKFEIPDVKLKGRTLIINADTMVEDPENEDNQFMKGRLTLQAQLYRTVNIGSLTAKGLSLKTLNCVK